MIEFEKFKNSSYHVSITSYQYFWKIRSKMNRSKTNRMLLVLTSLLCSSGAVVDINHQKQQRRRRRPFRSITSLFDKKEKYMLSKINIAPSIVITSAATKDTTRKHFPNWFRFPEVTWESIDRFADVTKYFALGIISFELFLFDNFFFN